MAQKALRTVCWRCARCVVVCAMREVTSVEEGHDVEHVTDMRQCDSTSAMVKLAREIDETTSAMVNLAREIDETTSAMVNLAREIDETTSALVIKTMEVPQTQYIDRFVDDPCCAW